MTEGVAFREVRAVDQMRTVARLARQIWNDHYPEIIGQAQVDYMLRKFQSEAAIAEEMAAGSRYFLIELGGEAVGYFAFRPEPAGGRMFLSKLYVRKEHRRRGLARGALEVVEQECRRGGFSRVRLAVNKRNHAAIAAYQRLGFRTSQGRMADIGGGFVMDDWIMEKAVDTASAPEAGR
ncbi:MAG TPA: GNAT family N-acetyltransferase [Kiritimatiellae bacterium]|nr:GNAT family N-acetyltransferase [Kiritimatiellia bacterium]